MPEPSNSDILTATLATSQLLGRLDGKIDGVIDDVKDLKAMSSSYVTHDALQMRLQALTAQQHADEARAAALPVAAAAMQSQDVADMKPKVNKLWGERFYVKGALAVLMAILGAVVTVGTAYVYNHH